MAIQRKHALAISLRRATITMITVLGEDIVVRLVNIVSLYPREGDALIQTVIGQEKNSAFATRARK